VRCGQPRGSSSPNSGRRACLLPPSLTLIREAGEDPDPYIEGVVFAETGRWTLPPTPGCTHAEVPEYAEKLQCPRRRWVSAPVPSPRDVGR
jgi:hypothetical protein